MSSVGADSRLCKKHYHMACLNPPLSAKPAKGYSWVCPPCSLQRDKDVQAQKFHYQPTAGPSTSTSRPKAASKAEKGDDVGRADVTFRGWPWRYFGLYTRAEDTLGTSCTCRR